MRKVLLLAACVLLVGWGLKLGQLVDVRVPSPAGDSVLKYNSTSLMWEAGTDNGNYTATLTHADTGFIHGSGVVYLNTTADKVGLGTSAPSARLSIKASDSTPASGLFIGGAAGGSITLIGAGTDTCYKLYINATGSTKTEQVVCPATL
jgi:hypothetical protein